MQPLLLPTAYFPPLNWYALIEQGNSICIEQMETFPKQTYRNRCEILTVSGKASLTVPVVRTNGNHTLTRDIRVSHREPWQRNHWRALQTAYNSSPYFTFYAEAIQSLLCNQETSLILYNHQIIQGINDLLNIDISITYSDDYQKIGMAGHDYRTLISPKRTALEIDNPVYPQVFSHLHGFVQGLSILDLLFNLGPEAASYLRDIEI